jgi:phosphate/sulfate permease
VPFWVIVAAAVAASLIGAPISTTTVLSSSVVGASQAQHGFAAANGRWIANILLAWIVTMPICASLAAFLYWALSFVF